MVGATRARSLALALAGIAALSIVVAGAAHIVASLATAAHAPDTQCSAAHATSSTPPARLATATDYRALGDYEYDRGDCAAAVAAYGQAIALDPADAAAYNNRAYTRMRQRDYAAALPDLDRAIALRPDYVNALMNRGDVYNYYLPDRARALADYDRVIAMGATNGTSVCGHRLLALHDGWNAGTVATLLTRGVDGGCAAPASVGS